ncbi:Ig-like domain-containing protein, partial [Ursidibacter sp. B-7004-1]
PEPKPEPEPEQPKPKIIINDIASDNILNKAESSAEVVLTGRVEYQGSQPIKLQAVINQEKFAITLGENNTWSVTIPGEKLKQNEGINNLKVIASLSNSETILTEENKEYSVDTIIGKPIIKINGITDDDIINAVESKDATIKISGTVTNTAHSEVKATDKVILKLGDSTQEVTLVEKNGEFTFEADVSTTSLVKHTQITAEIMTSDSAKNSDTTEVSRSYQVKNSIEKPELTIDDITGDNKINVAEAKTNITISGTVKNGFNGQKVILTCGCPSCTGTKWTDLEAIISEGKFQVDVKGADLVAAAKDNKMKIKANYTAVDEAKNSAKAAEVEKEYSVDRTQPKFSVTINPISDDGVINMEEYKKDKFTVTGSYLSSSGVFPTSQNLVIGTTKIPIKFNGTNFSVDISREVLLNNQENGTIKFDGFYFDVSSDDWDGTYVISAENTASLPVKYRFDLEPPKLGITVNPIPTINLEVAKQPITLSGQLNFDKAKVDEKSVQAEITINGKKHRAELDLENSSWSLTLPAGELTATQGNSQIQAVIKANSFTGNSGEHSATANYNVDTILPIATVELTVGDNNRILKTATGDVAITGAVKGDFKVGELVTLTFNGQSQSVEIKDGGSFSTTIPASKLLENSSQSITIQYQHTDEAGNVGVFSGTQSYAVATADIGISLEPLTTDNFINVTEGQKTITLKGKVWGNDLGNNPTVTVEVNGQTKTAVVNGKDLSVTLTLDELRDTSNYTLKATVQGQSNATAETKLQYDLDPNLIASIKIENIGDNFIVDAINTRSIRINGSVEFDGIYAKGQNARWLKTINVNIGDKVYTVGFDSKEKTFFVDVPQADFEMLDGKTITVDFNDSRQTYFPKTPVDLVASTNGSPFKMVKPTPEPEIKIKSLKLMSENHLIQKIDGEAGYSRSIQENKVLVSDDYKLNQTDNSIELSNKFESMEIKTTVTENNQYLFKLPEDFDIVTVTGKVNGLVKQGDKIDLHLNNGVEVKTYKDIEVNADKTFSAKISRKYFEAFSDGKIIDKLSYPAITAVLKVNNGLGKEVEVSDLAHFASTKPTSDVFVNKLTQANTNVDLPYFIKGVNSNQNQGFLTRINYGGNGKPLVLKYHFADKESSNAQNPNTSISQNGTYVDFSDKHKSIIEQAFKIISSYINIEFIKSDEKINPNEGITLYQSSFVKNYESSIALAYSGGNLYWQKGMIISEAEKENATEIERLYNEDRVLRIALHEITHNLQMQHTEYYANFEKKIVENFETEASSEFTLMSYNVSAEAESLRDLRMYDLAFLHYRFGVNEKQRAGNDVYTFKNYDYYSSDGAIYIWDGAGVDTFDASHEDKAVHVDLTPGSWIYRGENKTKYLVLEGEDKLSRIDNYFTEKDEPNISSVRGYLDYQSSEIFRLTQRGTSEEAVKFNNYTKDQAFIGFGTQIENLIGSKYDDELIGNKADNNISGGAGDDTIKGGEGNDYLDGGVGNDQLYGGLGDDIFVVDSANDTVMENANEGNDTIYSTVDFTLPTNVETLILIGNTAKNATGNGENNTLVANNAGNTLKGEAGDDRLIGGLGEDTLTGGDGSDVFVFKTVLNGKVDTITDFVSGTDKIELSRDIFSSLLEQTSNLSDYLKYDASAKTLSYDPDALGIADPIIFAKGLEAFDLAKDVIIV